MPIHYTVQAGDCIDSIALAHGLFPDTIWNEPANAALKNGRKDQNVLAPGDVVVIPDKRVKEHKAATNKVHAYRRKGVPKLFRVQVKLPSGAPLKGKPYELAIDAGPATPGSTDGDGWVQRYIPPDAREARLAVAGVAWTFELGQLDPVSEVRGIQGRLRALRYYRGEVDGTLGDDTVAAIKAYQMVHDLEVTGTVSDALRRLLVEENGA